MRLLIIFLFTIFPLYVSAQDLCGFFIPDSDYREGKAPDMKIELIEVGEEYIMAITPSKKDVPYEFDSNITFDLFIKNRSKISLSVADMKKELIADKTNGKTYTVYIYKPARVEVFQLKLGIIGIIYIEPFPGKIIGYTPLGGC